MQRLTGSEFFTGYEGLQGTLVGLVLKVGAVKQQPARTN